jgi:hypothetical protein
VLKPSLGEPLAVRTSSPAPRLTMVRTDPCEASAESPPVSLRLPTETPR